MRTSTSSSTGLGRGSAIYRRYVRSLWLPASSAVIFGLACSDNGTGPDPLPGVASVVVAPAASTIIVGESEQLSATTRDAAGNLLAGREVTWSTSDASVAQVTMTGLVTGTGSGMATVTASSEERTGSGSVTVVFDVRGVWDFFEVVADSNLDLFCESEAVVDLDQTGGDFSGSADQTGTCIVEGEEFDNSGVFEIVDGEVEGTTVRFTAPGEPGCDYVGTLAGDPPAEAAGVVACVGTVDGVPVNVTGIWGMTR